MSPRLPGAADAPEADDVRSLPGLVRYFLKLVVSPGPLIRRHENHPRLQGFIKGATAAAAGAIAGAAIVIGRDILTDASGIVLALIALGVLLQTKVTVKEPALVAAAAVAGVVLFS